MSESDAVRALRRALGGRLAAARKETHYTQREFARRISFSRSTLSTVESGVQRAGRGFWAACDAALGTGEEFQLGYDRIQAQLAADRQNAQSLRPSPGQQAAGLRAATLAEALRAYRALGWPVVTDASSGACRRGQSWMPWWCPGRRTAGRWLVARHRGAADEIRGLPALPDPRQALAVYHLRRAGRSSSPRPGRFPGRAERDRAGPHAGRARRRLAFPRGSHSGSSLRWA